MIRIETTQGAFAAVRTAQPTPGLAEALVDLSNSFVAAGANPIDIAFTLAGMAGTALVEGGLNDDNLVSEEQRDAIFDGLALKTKLAYSILDAAVTASNPNDDIFIVNDNVRG